MWRTTLFRTLLALLLCAAGAVAHQVASAAPTRDETVETQVCRLVERSAKARDLPTGFLTRLLWQESAFRADAVSPVGAQGVAQFMPETAGDRGLKNPFDPEQAIPAAAHFLSDLHAQFGNLGLAAAAYNAGPGRVSDWLAGRASLPAETRGYVAAITKRPVEDWRRGRAALRKDDHLSCRAVTAAYRRSHPHLGQATEPSLFWRLPAVMELGEVYLRFARRWRG